MGPILYLLFKYSVSMLLCHYLLLPCIVGSHISVHIIHGIIRRPLLYLWYAVNIPMYNAHPYFSLKNLCKKMHTIHSKNGEIVF